MWSFRRLTEAEWSELLLTPAAAFCVFAEIFADVGEKTDFPVRSVIQMNPYFVPRFVSPAGAATRCCAYWENDIMPCRWYDFSRRNRQFFTCFLMGFPL